MEKEPEVKTTQVEKKEKNKGRDYFKQNFVIFLGTTEQLFTDSKKSRCSYSRRFLGKSII